MTPTATPLQPVLAHARALGDAWLKTGWDGCRAIGPDDVVVELAGDCAGEPTASAPMRGRLRKWHLEVFGGNDTAERLAGDAELLSALTDRTTELADTTGALIDANDQLLAMYGLAESSSGATADADVIADLTNEARRLARGEAVLLSLADGTEAASGPHDVVDILRSTRDGAHDQMVRGGADGFDIVARRLSGSHGELLIASQAGRRFTTPDLQRIDAVTYFMSGLVALDAMHRSALASAVIERDAATAAELIQMTLPRHTPEIPGLEMAARCDPARLAAGDFYTWAETSDGVVFAVGDVSGKGLAAAIVMTAVTRATVRAALSNPQAPPTELFRILADELTDFLNEASVFTTMVIGVYRHGDRVVSMANAGHSPVLVRSGDATSPLPATAPPLGVLAELVPDTVEIAFAPGDTIMIGTDGLAEQEDDNGEQIGYDHLVDIVDGHADQGAKHLVAALFEAVEQYAGHHDQDDDRTALVLRRTAEEVAMSPMLRVAPDLASIREIGPWVHDCVRRHTTVADAAPFSTKTELALQEVAANIVRHGYADVPADQRGPIKLHAEFVDGALRIVIEDHGSEYAPEDQPVPHEDEPQVHGYGLMIVRQLTRRFEYERLGDINRTTLEFDLPSSSA